MITLILARYKEDITWAIDLPKIVYNKGEYLPDTISLPNIGREAHTYLHHIITNYDSLQGTYIFIQADPFPHARDFLNQLGECSGFVPLGGPSTEGPEGNFLYPHFNGLPIGKTFQYLFGETRNEFHLFYGACFKVDTKTIKARPLLFYKHLMEFLLSDELCEIRFKPYVFERLWSYFFDLKCSYQYGIQV